VHRLPSSHTVPSAAGGLEHTPVAGSHVPATRHCPWAMQVIGAVPVHTPPSQTSVCVQRLPSSHGRPFGTGGFEQVPVVGLHTPAR
jgi:hypothetical protein